MPSNIHYDWIVRLKIVYAATKDGSIGIWSKVDTCTFLEDTIENISQYL